MNRLITPFKSNIFTGDIIWNYKSLIIQLSRYKLARGPFFAFQNHEWNLKVTDRVLEMGFRSYLEACAVFPEVREDKWLTEGRHNNIPSSRFRTWATRANVRIWRIWLPKQTASGVIRVCTYYAENTPTWWIKSNKNEFVLPLPLRYTWWIPQQIRGSHCECYSHPHGTVPGHGHGDNFESIHCQCRRRRSHTSWTSF